MSACSWISIMKTVTTSSHSTPDWGAFAAFLARRSSLRAAFTLSRQSPDTGCTSCDLPSNNATQTTPVTPWCDKPASMHDSRFCCWVVPGGCQQPPGCLSGRVMQTLAGVPCPWSSHHLHDRTANGRAQLSSNFRCARRAPGSWRCRWPARCAAAAAATPPHPPASCARVRADLPPPPLPRAQHPPLLSGPATAFMPLRTSRFESVIATSLGQHQRQRGC